MAPLAGQLLHGVVEVLVDEDLGVDDLAGVHPLVAQVVLVVLAAQKEDPRRLGAQDPVHQSEVSTGSRDQLSANPRSPVCLVCGHLAVEVSELVRLPALRALADHHHLVIRQVVRGVPSWQGQNNVTNEQNGNFSTALKIFTLCGVIKQRLPDPELVLHVDGLVVDQQILHRVEHAAADEIPLAAVLAQTCQHSISTQSQCKRVSLKWKV